MLFGAKNEVVYGVGNTSGGAIGYAAGTGEAARSDAAQTPARLELLAAVWARQTGRTVVVASGDR